MFRSEMFFGHKFERRGSVREPVFSTYTQNFPMRQSNQKYSRAKALFGNISVTKTTTLDHKMVKDDSFSVDAPQ